MKEGYGAHLLTKPETIRDMVRQVRNRVTSQYSVSVKIRLLDEDRYRFVYHVYLLSILFSIFDKLHYPIGKQLNLPARWRQLVLPFLHYMHGQHMKGTHPFIKIPCVKYVRVYVYL